MMRRRPARSPGWAARPPPRCSGLAARCSATCRAPMPTKPSAKKHSASTNGCLRLACSTARHSSTALSAARIGTGDRYRKLRREPALIMCLLRNGSHVLTSPHEATTTASAAGSARTRCVLQPPFRLQDQPGGAEQRITEYDCHAGQHRERAEPAKCAAADTRPPAAECLRRCAPSITPCANAPAAIRSGSHVPQCPARSVSP